MTRTTLATSFPFGPGRLHLIAATMLASIGLVACTSTTTPNEDPVASFVAGCTDLDCTFDASASSDADGSVAGYAWDFGDGSSGTGAMATRAYASAGTFDVTLTVTDDDGATGTQTQQVSVSTPNQAPTASFTASCTYLDCTFDGSGSSDADGSITAYAWDFGDGGTDTGATASHTYASAGSYDVTVTVTDDGSATDDDTQSITVTVPIVQLGADLVGSAAGDVFGRGVAISASGDRIVVGAPSSAATFSQGGQVRAYEWDGSAWSQIGQDINATRISELLGDQNSLAISADGSRIAVGSDRANDAMGLSVGQVRVYDYTGSTWVQVGSTIDGPGNAAQLGWAVSLSADGTRLAATAPGFGAMGPGLGGEGQTFVYELVSGDWAMMGAGILGENPGDGSGRDVAMSSDGTRIVIGNDGNDEAASGAGSVRVYDWDGASWIQVGGDIDGNGNGASLGQSVEISGDGTRIGAYGGGSGDYAQIYQLVGSAWVQMGSDFSNGTSGTLHQLLSLSTDGGRLAMGKPNGGPAGHGEVEIYDWDGSAWSLLDSVVGDEVSDNLGWAVAMTPDGTRFVTGMPNFDDGGPSGDERGGARVFVINP